MESETAVGEGADMELTEAAFDLWADSSRFLLSTMLIHFCMNTDLCVHIKSTWGERGMSERR